MLKRFLFFLLFSVFGLFSGGVFAQNVSQNLMDLRLRFCNDIEQVGGTKELSLTTEPGKETPICLYLFNTHTKPLQVKVNFVDGTITNDEAKNKACKNEDEKNVFGKYVSFVGSGEAVDASEVVSGTSKNANGVFTLEPESASQYHASFTLPEGYAGKLYGCATVTLVEPDAETEGMFRVINRLGYPIEILVDGEIIPQLDYSKFSSVELVDKVVVAPELSLSQFEKQRIAHFALVNSGNVLQAGNFSLEYELPLGLGYQHYTGDFSVLPGEVRRIDIPLVLKWFSVLGNFNLQVSHHAVFDFDSDVITSKMREHLTLSPVVGFVVLDRVKLGIAFLLFLLLLISLLLFLKRFRGHQKDTSSKIHPLSKKQRTQKSVKKTETKLVRGPKKIISPRMK